MPLRCEDCNATLKSHETIACDRCKKDGVAFGKSSLTHVYSSSVDLGSYALTQKVTKDYSVRGHALQWQGRSFECPLCGATGTIIEGREMTGPRGRFTRIDIGGGTSKKCGES
jgi:Zn finger protein HypA/HybF involved in hydrogenase expression